MRLNVCPKCKKPVLSHTVCLNCGFYKGKEVINVPFCYGYDSQYLTTATTELQKIDLLPYDFKKEYYTVDRFCRENDIPVYVDCVDVSRKKDL